MVKSWCITATVSRFVVGVGGTEKHLLLRKMGIVWKRFWVNMKLECVGGSYISHSRRKQSRRTACPHCLPWTFPTSLIGPRRSSVPKNLSVLVNFRVCSCGIPSTTILEGVVRLRFSGLFLLFTGRLTLTSVIFSPKISSSDLPAGVLTAPREAMLKSCAAPKQNAVCWMGHFDGWASTQFCVLCRVTVFV